MQAEELIQPVAFLDTIDQAPKRFSVVLQLLVSSRDVLYVDMIGQARQVSVFVSCQVVAVMLLFLAARISLTLVRWKENSEEISLVSLELKLDGSFCFFEGFADLHLTEHVRVEDLRESYGSFIKYKPLLLDTNYMLRTTTLEDFPNNLWVTSCDKHQVERGYGLPHKLEELIGTNTDSNCQIIFEKQIVVVVFCWMQVKWFIHPLVVMKPVTRYV